MSSFLCGWGWWECFDLNNPCKQYADELQLNSMGFLKKFNYILCMPNCVCQVLYGMIETHGLSAKSSMFCFGMLAFNKYDLFLKRDTNEIKQTDCNQPFILVHIFL